MYNEVSGHLSRLRTSVGVHDIHDIIDIVCAQNILSVCRKLSGAVTMVCDAITVMAMMLLKHMNEQKSEATAHNITDSCYLTTTEYSYMK
eukprot:5959951-Pleurochrysis_carterae.AAC.3